MTINGFGPDVETVTNGDGGSQSDTPYRFDLIDCGAIFDMAKVLKDGAKKYGEWNWKKIGRNDHLNHAIAHLYAALSGDTQEPHLTHAMCRVMMAHSTGLSRTSKQSNNDKPIANQDKSRWPRWLLDANISDDANIEIAKNGDVVWHGGTWRAGTWKGGVWKAGTWLCGKWLDGAWYDGVWSGGAWRGGVWNGGEWLGGRWYRGVWLGGVWYRGVWNGGIWYRGKWRSGEWKSKQKHPNEMGIQ